MLTLSTKLQGEKISQFLGERNFIFDWHINIISIWKGWKTKQVVISKVIYLKLNVDYVQDFIFVTVAFIDSKASSAHKMSQHNHNLNYDASDLCPSPKTISRKI